MLISLIKVSMIKVIYYRNEKLPDYTIKNAFQGFGNNMKRARPLFLHLTGVQTVPLLQKKHKNTVIHSILNDRRITVYFLYLFS